MSNRPRHVYINLWNIMPILQHLFNNIKLFYKYELLLSKANM